MWGRYFKTYYGILELSMKFEILELFINFQNYLWRSNCLIYAVKLNTCHMCMHYTYFYLFYSLILYPIPKDWLYFTQGLVFIEYFRSYLFTANHPCPGWVTWQTRVMPFTPLACCADELFYIICILNLL